MAKFGLVLAITMVVPLFELSSNSVLSGAPEQMTEGLSSQSSIEDRDANALILSDSDLETGLEPASGGDGLELTTNPHWMTADPVSSASDK